MDKNTIGLWLSLGCMFGTTVARAGTLDFKSLNEVEQAEVSHFVSDKIRPDIQARFPKVLGEVVQRSQEIPPVPPGVSSTRSMVQQMQNEIMVGPDMTPETQAVLAEGVYQLISAKIAGRGLHIDRDSFDKNFAGALQFISKLGAFPASIAVGGMASTQVGVGVQTGGEYDLFMSRGKLEATYYNIMGALLGYGAMDKIGFYAALCFGSCTGGSAKGLYVGLDGDLNAGLGLNFFFEIGLDLTDQILAWVHNTDYSMKDLYQSKAVYVGFGFDVGVGAAVSGNVLYYDAQSTTVLADPGKKIDPSMISKLKLQ